MRWSAGEAAASGYDVSRRLLAMADPADPAYRPDWARLLDGLSVRDVYRVEIDLREAHPRPEAFLETPIIPYTMLRPARTHNAPRDAGPRAEREEYALPGNGPYVCTEATVGAVTYRRNERYWGLTPIQPREIVEQLLSDGVAAARALRRGEIQVWDRVTPWQVASLRADNRLTVRPYAMPRVHCLIPNLCRPALANRTLRRALACGIDRPAILEELLHGDSLPGSAVVQGLFSTGAAAEEAADKTAGPQIKPWACDRRLAMVLAEVGRKELAAGDKGRSGPVPPARLVLAYPPGEIARTACAAIERQLAAIGIAVEAEGAAGRARRAGPSRRSSAVRRSGPLGAGGRCGPRARRRGLGRRLQSARGPVAPPTQADGGLERDRGPIAAH